MGQGRKWGCTDEKRDGGEDSVELRSGKFGSSQGFIEGSAKIWAVNLPSAELSG